MDKQNTYLFIIILVIIISYFIYNYDIYVVKKGEKLCKNILVEKKKKKKENNEEFLYDLKKNNVINDTIKVLEKIPTKLSQKEMITIISGLNKIYQKTPNIKNYLEKVEKMKSQYPYNTKYSNLVSNLIVQFDLKNTKKKSKSVSFNENNNEIIHIDNNKKNDYETFSQIGEITNYSPF